MIRNISVCLVSVTFCAAALHAGNIDAETPTLISDYPSQASMLTDRINAWEMQGRVMVDRVTEHDREFKVWQEIQQRQFQRKFNQLVAAVGSFAKRYNEDKGTIWPQQEADKLRKAMRQLQSLEESLRDDRRAASAQRECDSTVAPVR